MTPEEQRIALVEACPNVFVRKSGADGWAYRSSVAGRILPCVNGDPLQDLNAMHEAVQYLRAKGNQFQWLDFHKWLLKIVHPHILKWSGDPVLLWDVIEATATQRAEAFLRTIGKWKD